MGGNKQYLAIIISFILICLPISSFAKMVALSDAELKEVTGQAGISITAEDVVDFDVQIGTVYYGDTDGFGANDQAAFLSLNDFDLKGTAIFGKPVFVNLQTGIDPGNNIAINAIDVSIEDVTVNIDHLKIGSITVGPSLGEGKSFGSFGIYNMHTRISGNIKISAK